MSSPRESALQPMVNMLLKRSLLNSEEIDAILALPFRLVDLGSVAYLVREGDPAEYCILLLSGFASRNKVAGSGARQILSVHMRGDIVDLHNSLLEVADHSVQALSRVEAAYIPRRAIIELVAAYPAIALALWRDTLIDGSIFREWILNVGQRSARQRVCHLLCEIATRQDEAGLSDGPDYQWTMTQEQIGDATGMTAVHVNRTIQLMRRDNLIGLSRQTLSIVDLPGLKSAGDFSSAYLHQAKVLAA